MTAKKFLLLLAAIWIWPALAAGAESTLRIRSWQAPAVFFPPLAFGGKDREICRIVYEPLASFDAEGEPIPVLAERIPSAENGDLAPDGRWVVWRLRPDLRWSDGRPVTAEDVRFTYDTLVRPENRTKYAPVYSAVRELEVLDDRTVRLRFAEPRPGWCALFSGWHGMILPRHVFEGLSAEELSARAHQPARVGTGPFVMTGSEVLDTVMVGNDVVRLTRIDFQRNPRYRDPLLPRFDRLAVFGGGDAAGAARAVLTDGTADFAWNLQIPPDTLDRLAEGGIGRLIFAPSAMVERLALNHADPGRIAETGERSSVRFPHPFLSDRRVRRAFAHAIDREAVAAIYGGGDRPCANMLVLPARYRSPGNERRYPHDPARAAALLTEAGWTDSDGDGIRDRDGRPMRVRFETSVNPVRQAAQRIIQGNLAAVGADADLAMMDASVFFQNRPDEDTNIFKFYADLQLYSSASTSPDPVSYMGRWTCEQIAQAANGWSGLNRIRWCDPVYDALCQRARSELDPDARRRILMDLNDRILEEAAMIPLVHRAIPAAAAGLRDLTFTPWDSYAWAIADWRPAGD